jgi:hypothetical protein
MGAAMYPTADHVRMIRYTVLAVIRVTAFLFLVFGAVSVLYIVLMAPFEQPSAFWFFGAASVLPAALILALSVHLVRWLVPMPAQDCPGCGYDLRQSTSDRCPECGVILKQKGTTEGEG